MPICAFVAALDTPEFLPAHKVMFKQATGFSVKYYFQSKFLTISIDFLMKFCLEPIYYNFQITCIMFDNRCVLLLLLNKNHLCKLLDT